MREAVNFEEIAESVRSYVPPDEFLGSPFTICAPSEDFGSDLLVRLMQAIEKRDYSVEKCQFYMHPDTFEELRQSKEFQHINLGSLNAIHGRPVRTHHTIPRDFIMLAAPDAIGLGGEVYVPRMIAYADLEGYNE